ncbi:MAG: ferritin-like domain-containing protein [Candidatus Acidiferrales bacterium]
MKGTTMETGHELFLYELKDMLDAEQQLVNVLEENANDSSRPELEKAFRQHGKETEGHVKRLEQCFELLDEEPETAECHGVRGLAEEKKSFIEENPSEDLIDVFNVGAGIKAETYEICSYTSLIDMARDMNHRKVVQLLNQNLKEEKAALRKMEMFHKKVKPEKMMSEQEESEGGEQEERGSRSRRRGSRRKRAA